MQEIDPIMYEQNIMVYCVKLWIDTEKYMIL